MLFTLLDVKHARKRFSGRLACEILTPASCWPRPRGCSTSRSPLLLCRMRTTPTGQGQRNNCRYQGRVRRKPRRALPETCLASSPTRRPFDDLERAIPEPPRIWWNSTAVKRPRLQERSCRSTIKHEFCEEFWYTAIRSVSVVMGSCSDTCHKVLRVRWTGLPDPLGCLATGLGKTTSQTLPCHGRREKSRLSLRSASYICSTTN